MTFPIPSKYANPVCGDCHDTNEKKYHKCTHPCSHLVSWCIHQQTADLVIMARQSFEELEDFKVGGTD